MEKDDIQFKYFTPHCFRHSFATRCIENGMQPQILKALMGHNSLSITYDLYGHVLPDIKKRELEDIVNGFKW